MNRIVDRNLYLLIIKKYISYRKVEVKKLNKINLEKKEVKKILEKIHVVMEKKHVPRVNRQRNFENYIEENRLLRIICEDYSYEPYQIALSMNNKFGYDLNGSDVISSLKKRKLGHPARRNELFTWANKAIQYLGQAINGDKKSFEKFQDLRQNPIGPNLTRHEEEFKLLTIMLYYQYPEMDIYKEVKEIYKFGVVYAKYFFYDVVDIVADTYHFPRTNQSKKYNSTATNEIITLTKQDLINKLAKLENDTLKLEKDNNMLNNMLTELQDDFERQLEESKLKEFTHFFSQLNSEKYGCVLDELLVIRRQVKLLRKNKFDLPIELNGLLILIEKLTKFVQDNHINPLKRSNDIINLTFEEAQFCIYDGSPYENKSDMKKVKIISPGWVYNDIQISRPKVMEVTNNAQ